MKLSITALASLLLVATGTAHAQTQTASVTYAATQGPWNIGANPTLDYGAHDNLLPSSVSNGFDFSIGNIFTIAYVSGTTTNGYGPTSYDANGQTDDPTSNSRGVSGTYFPSAYVSGSSYPVYLSQAIGAFADATGKVIGTPFVIGDAAVQETVSGGGVTQILFGNNDDVFSDDTGSITLDVSGPALASPGAVPEPATWAMMILGFGLIGLAIRRRNGATVGDMVHLRLAPVSR